MPQVFKIGPYWVYFWANEGDPQEPIHVHVSEGAPSANATKIWITSTGKCLLSHNSSKIPAHHLRNIMRTVEAQNEYILEKWIAFFGNVTYFC